MMRDGEGAPLDELLADAERMLADISPHLTAPGADPQELRRTAACLIIGLHDALRIGNSRGTRLPDPPDC